MPTGTVVRDPRGVLLAAGERVLARGGASAMTSRSVTDEAGVAKGMLHRYFADFDAFLVELVRQRIARTAGAGLRLETDAGDAAVVSNLAAFFTEVFDPVGLALVGLLMTRDELRRRLREQTPRGLPLLVDATRAAQRYLEIEQRDGRIRTGLDTASLARTLVGTAHLLLAGEEGALPTADALDEVLSTALLGALR